MLARYGAPAEVLTDQGSKFRGEFHELLLHHGIDHRIASREHPQSDGLAERMVQTMKRGLRKSLQGVDVGEWDRVLPYVAMGYRMTVQRALGYSPYFLLFGRHPIFPAKVQELEKVHMGDDPEEVRRFVDERGQVFQEVMPLAFRNLAIAQHRDKTRFLKVRGGGWDRPKASSSVGDKVLVRRPTKGTLDVPTHPNILEVAEVRPRGVLLLRGRNGVVLSEQAKNVAPCSVPVEDSVVRGEEHTVGNVFCRECGRRDGAHGMLVCDQCQKCYHFWCLEPA